MDEMEDDDYEINRPLDKRFVAVGLLFFVLGMFGTVYFRGSDVAWVFFAMLVSFPFIATKKEKHRQ